MLGDWGLAQAAHLLNLQGHRGHRRPRPAGMTTARAGQVPTWIAQGLQKGAGLSKAL